MDRFSAISPLARLRCCWFGLRNSASNNGDDATKHAAAAKWWACMGGHRVSHTCQHLHGGIGADVDYPIHRHFLRLKHVAMTLGGSSEQLAGLGALIAAEAKAGIDPGAILD